MNNFNFVIIEGNLVSDPTYDNGEVKFSVVSNRDIIKDGETISNPLTVNIKVYSKLGEVCFKYLKQGSKVLVSGNLCNDYILGKEVNFLTPK